LKTKTPALVEAGAGYVSDLVELENHVSMHTTGRPDRLARFRIPFGAHIGDIGHGV
jgi:hypothetical protein